MTAVFISHSSRDRALVEDLCARLRAQGYAALFLDVDERDGIAAGRDWERELYLALRRSDGVVFLATESSVTSRWCFAELALARSRGVPVFALRATPQARLGLLSDIQWVDLPTARQGTTVGPQHGTQNAEVDEQTAYRRLWAGMLRAGLDPDDALAWDPARSPYPGLRAFSVEDAAVFFGRDEETRRLLELVQPTVSLGGGRWVSLVGPSGSGKSSLLCAGLLPRLSRRPDHWVLVPPFVPGTRPVHQLAVSLAGAFEAAGRPRAAHDLERSFTDPGADGTPSAALVRVGEDLTEAAAAPGAKVLICVDQAEEVITRCTPAEQQAFQSLLRGAVGEGSPVWVVATLRSEFLSTAPERTGLSECTDDFLVLEPISRARLSEVIARPAARAGLIFEAGLIERMVEETTGGDALPLLGHTLFELAALAGEGGQVTTQDYEALGGVVGSLQRRAAQVFAELTARGYGEEVLPALVRLVTVDASGQFVRRRLETSRLSPRELAVVEAFVEARLLSSDRGEDGEDSTVEVTHEALLRQWLPLHRAISAAESSLRMRAELERETADWVDAGRDPSYLLRGARLAEFVEWVDEGHDVPGRPREPLGTDEAAYLQASRELAAAELRAVQRSNRRLRRLLAGVGALLLATVVAAGIAVAKNAEATREARSALTQQLTAQTYATARSQPELSLLLGVEAMGRDSDQDGLDAAAVAAFQSLNRSFHVLELYLSRRAAVRSVAYSPDGGLLAVGGDDHRVTVWDTATGTRHGPELVGHSDVVQRVTFSPDGTILASASADASVRLWDVATGRAHGGPLSGHEAKVSAVVFTPDGDRLASAAEDGTVRLWDVATGRPRGAPLTADDAALYGVAVSPDGELIAATAADGTVWLWPLGTSDAIGMPIARHPGGASGVAFSPDSALLATSGSDGAIRFWDPRTATEAGEPLVGHTGEISHIAFSPDGALLASAGRDGTVRLWDVAGRTPRGQPLTGHTNAARSVVFSPDGGRLASASFDGTVRVWQVAPTVPGRAPLRGHVARVTALAGLPSGDRFVSAAADGTAALWDLTEATPRHVLSGHLGWVTAAAVSRDGALVATGGADRTIRLWDGASGAPVGTPLRGHEGEVTGVAFSPDGAVLVSGGRDGTVRWWDVATRSQLGAALGAGLGELMDVALSPDGELIAAAGSEGVIRAWDLTTRLPAGRPLTGHSGWVLDLEFSADSRTLASASGDGTVRLWDVPSWSQRGRALLGASQEMTAVALSPDQAYLAATGEDATVRIWRTDDGQPVGEPISTGGEPGTAIAFGARPTLLFVAGLNGHVRIWDLDPATLTDQACATAHRNLTRSEWSRYVGPRYRATCPRWPVPDPTDQG